MVGKTLAHYRIVEKIGAGGMGEVYRATDSKLGRDVALKFLPPGLADDLDRLARFEHEARVLASLNHPGIASIYGIEEAGGLRFLVMELVEGEDLARRLARGPLALASAVDIARQMAEALEAAHARGVVHRDLKPSNIQVNSQGRVKILDFGLAKALDDAPTGEAPENAPTVTGDRTHTGVILGTAASMSPEQARGDSVDTRSDVWSFGCVLWECLTGAKPFGGRTASDTIGAILHLEPDWSALPSDVPANVRRVLQRCLVKDRGKRLHHIADARIELSDVEGPVEAAIAGSELRDRGRAENRYRRALLVTGSLLLVTLGTLAADRFELISLDRKPRVLENPLAGAKFTRLTDFPGDEFDAAISSDGRFVVFVSDRDGPFDVLVGQIGNGEFRNLTHRTSGPGPEDVRAPVRSVGFTRDGTEVWFGGGTGRRLQAIPLLGGSFRNLLGEEAVNLDWSPDGHRIVYHLRTGGDPVFVADRSGANSSMILASAEGDHQHYPTWSPDGKWIYLVRGRPTTGEMNLWRLEPDGTRLQQLTENKLYVGYPAPIDARTVLFCAQEMDGAGPWLWALDVGTQRSTRIGFGLEHYTSVSSSADGRRVVATVEDPRASLWSVPILERAAGESDVSAFPVPNVRAMGPRFAGNELFYLSSRGSGEGLWRYRDGEALEIWQGNETPLVGPAAISADGQRVALVLRQGDRQRLHVLTADGAELRALTGQVDVRGSVAWSPDGRWVVAGGSEEAGTPGLYKIPADGGPPERILEGQAFSPVWSPDGSLIVYEGAQVQATARLHALRPNGDAVELPEIAIYQESGGARTRFLADGSGLVYMQGLSPSQDFYLLDIATMKSRRLTRFEDPSEMRTFDITPDGSKIVFDRLRRNSDIVLIELSRPGGGL